MPNWCFNKVTFIHSDLAEIKRVVEAYSRDALFSEFVPCPQDLVDTVAGSFDDTEEQAALEAKQVSNRDKYGYANWYDWCVANWGTKWDINSNDDQDVPYSEDRVELYFDTAWSPPIPFYEKMEELGFTVDGYYYEPGMGYCGRYNDGDDDYYEIEGDAKWVLENIPGDINDTFSISDNMEGMEDDEE